ncbi:MAG: hypothetical protein K6G01_07640 [Eubacterium sp.]|nr:hypothetical protein [Eubacterium sp.]
MWKMLLNGQMIIWLVLLGIASVQDMKTRSIHVAIPFTAMGIGIIGFVMCDSRSLTEMLIGLSIGMVFLCVSLGTKGKIGLGDAFMILASAFYFSGENILRILLVAGVISFVILVVMHLRKKKIKELPFMPFLFGGSVVVLCI